MVTVVKYGNRKLYSKATQKYVNIGEILGMIESGVEVEVYDHKTKNNITPEVVLRAKYERDLKVVRNVQ